MSSDATHFDAPRLRPPLEVLPGQLTLTTPDCPVHGSIEKEVLITLERPPGVEWVDVGRVGSTVEPGDDQR